MVWFARAEQDAARPRAAPDWFDGGALLLTAVFVLVQLLRPLPALPIQTDSPGYLNFASTRTAGYPLFLRVVEHLPGGLIACPCFSSRSMGLPHFFYAAHFGAFRAANLPQPCCSHCCSATVRSRDYPS